MGVNATGQMILRIIRPQLTIVSWTVPVIQTFFVVDHAQVLYTGQVSVASAFLSARFSLPCLCRQPSDKGKTAHNPTADGTNFQWQPVQTQPARLRSRRGCFAVPNCSGEAHLHLLFTSQTGLYPELCIKAAARRGMLYAAVENGLECYGGDDVSAFTSVSSDCTSSCTGETSSTCGGSCAAEIYDTGKIVRICVPWV